MSSGGRNKAERWGFETFDSKGSRYNIEPEYVQPLESDVAFARKAIVDFMLTVEQRDGIYEIRSDAVLQASSEIASIAWAVFALIKEGLFDYESLWPRDYIEQTKLDIVGKRCRLRTDKDRLSLELRKSLEQPVATAIDAEREGPTEPNNWIDGSGKKIETFLPPKAYMLLKTVWGGTNKTASFDLIYKDVFDDALTEVSSILDHQKLVRKFLQPLDYTMKTDSTQRHCFIKSISQLQ